MCIDLPGSARIDPVLHTGPAVALRFSLIDAGNFDLVHPVEAASLSTEAIALRQREFAAGRACAAQAMCGLGLRPKPVPMGQDRSPVWPDGFVGSISHSRTLAGAALALRSSGIRALGLDLEEAEPLANCLIEEICVESERNWLASQIPARGGLLAKAIFSAKEAVYKCQYPLTHKIFGFEMIEIDLQLDRECFSAWFSDDVSPFRRGDRLDGQVWLSGGHIVSLVTLP